MVWCDNRCRHALLSVAVPSVSSVQAGVLSARSDHNADAGLEEAARAVERAADEEAWHGRNGGDLGDHEEVPSAEAMWADGGCNDTGHPAHPEHRGPAADGQSLWGEQSTIPPEVKDLLNEETTALLEEVSWEKLSRYRYANQTLTVPFACISRSACQRARCFDEAPCIF